MLCLPGRCTLLGGRLPERPMGADCKSVAKATQVRILHLPPRSSWYPGMGAGHGHARALVPQRRLRSVDSGATPALQQFREVKWWS
ncbi:hypothetical protein BN9982_190034 [Mycobacterium tuberculosis]|nr:hypothetical protein BN9982_190034 [Mycobacterium tuberculosis]